MGYVVSGSPLGASVRLGEPSAITHDPELGDHELENPRDHVWRFGYIATSHTIEHFSDELQLLEVEFFDGHALSLPIEV